MALLPYMFTRYICSWYGSPYNCYYLHGYTKKGLHGQLWEDEELRVVEDSDDINESCHHAGVFQSDEEVWRREENEEEE